MQRLCGIVLLFSCIRKDRFKRPAFLLFTFLFGRERALLSPDRSDALVCRADPFLKVSDVGPDHAVAVVEFIQPVAHRLDLIDEFLGPDPVSRYLLLEVVQLTVEVRDGLGNDLQLLGREFEAILGFLEVLHDLLRVVEPEGNVDRLFLLDHREILLGFLRVPRERTDALFEHADDVAQTVHIDLGRCELAFAFLFVQAVLRDARGFLEDVATILALARDDLGDPPLPDDGVALASDTGVQKQLGDIAQTAGLFIDHILALPRAVIPSCDGDLVVGEIDAVVLVRIVKRDRNLGKPHRAPHVGTAENDVLHLGPAKRFARDLAEHPAHRVGQIGLAASVRTDDHGRSFLES